MLCGASANAFALLHKTASTLTNSCTNLHTIDNEIFPQNDLFLSFPLQLQILYCITVVLLLLLLLLLLLFVALYCIIIALF